MKSFSPGASGPSLLGGLLAGLLWWALLPGPAALAGPGALGAVMPELDGVHPVRALEALERAYAPSEGFPDKYPPLGSVLMGLAVALSGAEPGPGSPSWSALDPAARARALWERAPDVLAALEAERSLSLVAMGLAVVAAVVLASWLAGALGVRPGLARLLAPVLVLATFGSSYPVAYYAGTTNVDALALAAGLWGLVCVVTGRPLRAAALVALATAVKDPYFVLGPVVLLGAAWPRGEHPERRGTAATLARAGGLGLAVYALASGALTTPGVWWEHLVYLVDGGVSGVDRIDPGDPSAWPGLLGYAGGLVLNTLGAGVVVLGLVGLGLLARGGGRREAVLLAAPVVTTLALFVLPAGFVYVRFLLVVLAVLGVAAAVTGSLVVEWALTLAGGQEPVRRALILLGLLVGLALADEAYGALAGGTRWGGAPRRPVAELEQIAHEPDPRRLLADALEEQLPAGSRLVLFTDAREHGPPLEPGRWDLSVRGLHEAEGLVTAWVAGPPEARPEALVLLSFPTESPAGSGVVPEPPPRVGERVAVHWRVAAVHGRPRQGIAERTLACRPTATLLLLEPL